MKDPTATGDGDRDARDPNPGPQHDSADETADDEGGKTADDTEQADPEHRERQANANEERPGPLPARFLAELPDDPRIQRLAEAFEAGNYARVRSDAPALLASDESEEVRQAARELLDRIQPDPLAKYLLAVSVLLFIAVVAFAYGGHAH